MPRVLVCLAASLLPTLVNLVIVYIQRWYSHGLVCLAASLLPRLVNLVIVNIQRWYSHGLECLAASLLPTLVNLVILYIQRQYIHMVKLPLLSIVLLTRRDGYNVIHDTAVYCSKFILFTFLYRGQTFQQHHLVPINAHGLK